MGDSFTMLFRFTTLCVNVWGGMCVHMCLQMCACMYGVHTCMSKEGRG